MSFIEGLKVTEKSLAFSSEGQGVLFGTQQELRIERTQRKFIWPGDGDSEGDWEYVYEVSASNLLSPRSDYPYIESLIKIRVGVFPETGDKGEEERVAVSFGGVHVDDAFPNVTLKTVTYSSDKDGRQEVVAFDDVGDQEKAAARRSCLEEAGFPDSGSLPEAIDIELVLNNFFAWLKERVDSGLERPLTIDRLLAPVQETSQSA